MTSHTQQFSANLCNHPLARFQRKQGVNSCVVFCPKVCACPAGAFLVPEVAEHQVVFPKMSLGRARARDRFRRASAATGIAPTFGLGTSATFLASEGPAPAAGISTQIALTDDTACSSMDGSDATAARDDNSATRTTIFD